MRSSRAFFALLLGMAILTQPILGNGPGPDTEYTYQVTPLDFSDNEAVESLYNHPEVVYGTNEQLDVTRNAANETFSRPEDAVSDAVRDLVDGRFLADDFGDQYYRLDGRIENGTFELDSDSVSARTVAVALAKSPENASQPIAAAVTADRTSDTRVAGAVVRTDDDFVIVYPTESRPVSDPYAVPKIISYALAVSFIIWAGVMLRTEV